MAISKNEEERTGYEYPDRQIRYNVRPFTIIFSTEMVRAILDGQKTQTRRVIKPQPYRDKFYGPEWYRPVTIDKNGEEVPGKPVYGIYGVYGIYSEWGEWGIKCPYYPGMILWVRETWQLSLAGGFYVYKADPGRETRNKELCKIDPTLKWRSPRFMPRAAARIFLEVKDVRVERLQDITEEDAIKEGFGRKYDCNRIMCEACYNTGWSYPPVLDFMETWNHIYGKKYPWESNPWVWVISFERTDKPKGR